MDDRFYRMEREAVAIPASSLPAPSLSYVVADECWRLDAPYTYAYEGHSLRVPAGFHFDLASVPRALWWLVAPFELSVAAPLLHDFLYRYEGDPPAGSVEPPRRFDRAQADRLFADVMRAEGVAGWRRWLAFRAVRLFGGGAWGRGPQG